MRTIAGLLVAVTALILGVDARARATDDPGALDHIVAALDRGAFDEAERALAAIVDDTAASASPFAQRLAAARLRAALWRGRFDDAAALDATIAASPPTALDASVAAEIAFARAEYQRSRPRAGADDESRAWAAAEALYGESLRAGTSAQLATRFEWRGNIRTRMVAVHAADADFREAEALFRTFGDDRGAARCLRRRATNLAAAGEPALALGVLELHQAALERLADPALLPELRDSIHLAAVLAVRAGDLDRADTIFERQRSVDAGLQSGLTLSDMFLWSDRAQRMQSDLVLELARYVERKPRATSRALDFAERVVDHLQATTLSTALRRSSAARGGTATTAEPANRDVARLRLFRASPQDVPAELVVMYRHRDRHVFARLGRSDRIESRAAEFLDRWFTPAGLRGAPADYARDALELFDLVCGPAAERIAADPPVRLALLVNGPLEDLPFEALTIAPSSADDFAALPYVVRSTSVLRIPALSTLRELPAPNGVDRAIAVLDPELDDPRLPRLVHARDESDALCSVHRDCEILAGGLATLPRLQAALKRAPAGWLHLACHAEWTRVGHTRAVLRLAPGGGKDGRLDLDRVVGLDDPLPLTPGIRVVLSGCATALGPMRPGEGMLGLWRAFLFRGASCVISTLRPVDDRAGAAWMSAFHRHAARLPAADAARAASIDWLDGTIRPRFPRGFAAHDTAHPQLWAIAIVVGNDGGALP